MSPPRRAETVHSPTGHVLQWDCTGRPLARGVIVAKYICSSIQLFVPHSYEFSFGRGRSLDVRQFLRWMC